MNPKFAWNSKPALALVLAALITTVGCSSQWISVALADLPVLVQMSLNIATLTATVQGRAMNANDGAAIQKISSEAAKDLTLLQTLYDQYKAAPDATNLRRIQDAVNSVQQNLPSMLQTSHIVDAALSSKVSAAVSLILTTVNSFAALVPHGGAMQMHTIHANFAALPPTAKELKGKWNAEICAQRECAIQ